ncbi:extracellular matrix-binding ebh [Babesia caballi]|uniref:Extracellular matrix-binding ebh n=1 Tax=Babesia caballi TaxID=5871 RepID=A0AAV4M2D2_BABCB|nr:extracellular matrix-binding ebh [Babesia caballi]
MSPSGKPLTECPSNLKEAIDWILRVTGKDGGQGGSDNGATDALAKHVQQLLQEVKVADPNFSAEIENIKEALGNDHNGLIGKLAEGLQQFLGYDSRGKITGGGILPANVAKHQVCNAVLNFVIRFLEGLCGIKELNDKPDKQKVLAVIAKLRKCVGSGQVPTGFGTLVDGIAKKVDGIDKKVLRGPNQNKLKDVFTQLKVIHPEETGTSISGESQAVQDFLGKVERTLKQDNSVYFKAYCEKLAELLNTNDLKGKAQKDTEALSYTSFQANIQGVSNAARALNSEIHRINTTPGKNNLLPNAAVFTAVRDAATAFIADVKDPGKYTSYYNGAQNRGVNVQCAKIFLSCIPLFYQALTYLYWGCHDKGGGWGSQTLANGALRSYFDSQGLLSPYVGTNKRGAHIAESALKGFQAEFTKGMTKASSPSPFTYSTFTKELQDKVTTNGNQLYSNCPLSALYHGASCYFRCQQITNAKSAAGAPQTIREMLYFLAALQFSPQYDAFDGYVTEYFKAVTGNQSGNDSDLKLQVADSGITPKPGSSASSDTLSAADLKSHLASTFHLAPAFIGLIQDHSASDKSDPWLHSLFSNSQFNLSIPSSGAGIFGALSNYAYALQFQLSFLYIQCRNTYTVGCGWNQCTFGKTVNQNTTTQIVESHICSVGCTRSTTDHKDGNHATGDCGHDGCGKQPNKGSPLQAFLTDNLQGFTHSLPGSSGHLDNHPTGSMCHVPMGFQSTDLRDSTASKGAHISVTLDHFCGGFNTPLRQLSEKLGCLTKRTPRTLGDLFGFMWHLNGQLFKDAQIMYGFKTAVKQKPPSVEDFITKFKTAIGSHRFRLSPEQTGIVKSFESMGQKIPFLYQLFMLDESNSLPDALFDLTYHCHKWESGSSRNSTRLVHKDHIGKSCSNPNDLWSLYQLVKPKPTQNNDTDPYKDCRDQYCGGYLYPLTHSDGATFAPTHASTYLSWVLYLSDDLQSWFQDMLDEFKNIDCKVSGCAGQPKCSENHASGTHGTSSSPCSCPSVVDCVDFLPLLYRHGFRFLSAFRLKGMKWENSNSSRTYKQTSETKRTCAQFYSQLQSVISGNPLSNLLTSIDTFLYAIRWEFFSKLSGFWAIYISLILYTFFFLLDTLHLRSHLKLTSSHTVPPLALLTSGNPLPITKLTYIGQ